MTDETMKLRQLRNGRWLCRPYNAGPITITAEPSGAVLYTGATPEQMFELTFAPDQTPALAITTP